MDSTELHYVTYDPEAIWKEMMLAYITAGGDVLYPGDEKEMLLRSVQADIVQVFAGVDNALRMQTLRYAVGDYLDIIGEKRGCTRIQAAAARATVSITTNVTGKSSTLAAGTAMTADGEVFYLLVDALTLNGYEQTMTAEVIADRTGSAGNGLKAGTEMSLADVSSGVNSIVVTVAAAGGNEAEDDDTYRERIRAYALARVGTGPARQYETIAKTVSSDILDAKAINAGAGNVVVYLLLSTQTGADGILKSVEEALSAEDVRPLTDHVTVQQATDIPYALKVKYSCDNASQTNAAISAAVKDYQEWQDNTIGQAFNPDRLMAMLYQAGATRVIWDTGSAFNGGSVTYTEIAENKRCKGEITLMAM